MNRVGPSYEVRHRRTPSHSDGVRPKNKLVLTGAEASLAAQASQELDVLVSAPAPTTPAPPAPPATATATATARTTAAASSSTSASTSAPLGATGLDSTGLDSTGLNTTKLNSSDPRCKPEPLATGAESTNTLEHYIARLENTVLSWERYGLQKFDEKTEALGLFVTELQAEFTKGSRDKALAMVKYLESTSIGHEVKDLELLEKLARGVEYLEKTVEDSRLSQAVQTAMTAACDRLLTIDELPEPWRENPYIVRGYRFSATPRECLWSIFHAHNETTNIWTHLLGAFLFVGLALFHLPTTVSWREGTWVDRVPMIVFVVAALKCLLCSVTWHSFCSISHLETKRRMACVDYTGITICICASILTTEYSVLKCHPFAQSFYMFITLVCGGAGIAMNWDPRFDTTGARPLRALFFCCFAVFGGLGGLHAMYYRGAAETLQYYIPVLKSLACYGTGVLFYATLFPERIFTGIFDYLGMSHNIWHAFVVAGIYYHYKAMIEIFETAIRDVCPV